MIGYITNGYKLWSPEKNKIYYGRDIKFDETKFRLNTSDTELWLPVEESCEEETRADDRTSIDTVIDDSSKDEFYTAENEGDTSIQKAEEKSMDGPSQWMYYSKT